MLALGVGVFLSIAQYSRQIEDRWSLGGEKSSFKSTFLLKWYSFKVSQFLKLYPSSMNIHTLIASIWMFYP